MIAAFNRFGIDAFSIETVEDAVEFLEGLKDIAVLLINLTKEQDELDLVKTVVRRWPSVRLILLSARLNSLCDLPPVVFVAKPTTPMALIAVIEWVALDVGSNLDSPKG